MLWQIFKWLLFYWVLVLALFFIFQRSLIYLPNKHHVQLNHFDKTRIELLAWQNPSGIRMIGFYHPPPKNRPVLVFFHGNAGNIAGRKPLMHLFIEKDYGVFMPEYRGYGGLSGRPSEQGLYEDARSAILHLNHLGIAYKDMIIMGESLGSGVAIEMVNTFPVKGLILQAPFLTLKVMANLHYPYIKLPILDKFNNLNKIRSLTLPILIIHGSEDKIVPHQQGKILYEEANASIYRQFKTVDGGSHQLPWDDNFVNLIDEFITCINSSSTHQLVQCSPK